MARDAVAFAGVVPSTHARNSGYFCRVGVLPKHQGFSLQRRLMRAIEAEARRIGWDRIVSDTTDNLASANNFIAAGYRLYVPEIPWGWLHTLYWQKRIGRLFRFRATEWPGSCIPKVKPSFPMTGPAASWLSGPFSAFRAVLSLPHLSSRSARHASGGLAELLPGLKVVPSKYSADTSRCRGVHVP